MKQYWTYILTNRNNRVLYIGVTNNLHRRIAEHKNGTTEGFTKKYKLNKLVWLQEFSSPIDAIASEKMIKGWLRSKKEDLINATNPRWDDLAKDLDSSLRSE